MSKKQKRFWLLIAFVFSLCITYCLFTPLFEHPAHIMLEPASDGGKNYFTYLFHVLYGKGYWFDGMNYPYGEHVVYTDNQPVLSMLLAGLRRIAHIDANTALAIMHIALLINYIMAIVITYKILISYSVRPWLAILFAALVIVMSPQLFRFTGHFSLAYVFYIPALIYFFICHNSTGARKYAMYIFLMSVLMAFMHPYFLGIGLMMGVFYSSAYLVFNGGKLTERLMKVLPLVFATLGAMLTVKAIMFFTDPWTDRPVQPYGTFECLTRNADVLTSEFSPVWQTIRAKGWYQQLAPPSEGYSYIGLVAIVTLCFTLLVGIRQLYRILFRKEDIDKRAVIRSVTWLSAAFASLAIAKGIPFKWNMQWLLDHISALRQFRTLGRLSWLFYYIATIYSVLFINRYYERLWQRRKILAYLFIALPLCIWGLEAKGYVEWARQRNSSYQEKYDWFFMNKEKNWNQFLQEHGYKASDFQAVLTLPFTHIGTEKIWLNAFHNWNMVIAFRACVQLGLPMVDVNMSRSSWGVAEKQVKIAAGAWAEKPMLTELKSIKPFLLLVYDELSWGIDQEYLIAASDTLEHFGQFHVYACYPARIRKNDSLVRSVLRPVAGSMPVGDTCISCKSIWYVDHFSNGKARGIFGNSLRHVSGNAEYALANVPVTTNDTGLLYEVSMWALLDKNNYRAPVVYIRQFDQSGNKIEDTDMLFKESTDNDGGLWFRASRYFTIRPTCRKIELTLFDPEMPSYLGLDELVLRPANATVISRQADGRVMTNNHIFYIKKTE